MEISNVKVLYIVFNMIFSYFSRNRCDRILFGFTTTCGIRAYHHVRQRCEFESRSWRDVLDTTLCDKVCQWVAAGLWFSPGTPVYSKTKTNCHVITEILLKVALNTITPSIFFHCLCHDSVKSSHLKSYDCPHVD